MKGLKKFLITVVSALMLCLFCVGVTACGDGGNSEPSNVFTVTVQYEDGSKVEGVYVQICLGEEKCSTPVKTNAEGKATVTLPEDWDLTATYDVKPMTTPAGYTCAKVQTTVGTQEYTLVLVAAAE